MQDVPPRSGCVQRPRHGPGLPVAHDPRGVGRVGVLSAAGVLRALCGVAGGSSKASLSAHFARGGNLAEVNAVSGCGILKKSVY